MLLGSRSGEGLGLGKEGCNCPVSTLYILVAVGSVIAIQFGVTFSKECARVREAGEYNIQVGRNILIGYEWTANLIVTDPLPSLTG